MGCWGQTDADGDAAGNHRADFMYIQNFVIKHGGTRQPTATSVVTTVYVLMMSRLFSVFDRHRNRRERVCLYHEGLHYLMVIAHFFVGALVTALLSRHIGFYSLGLALLVLVLFTLRIWGYMAAIGRRWSRACPVTGRERRRHAQ